MITIPKEMKPILNTLIHYYRHKYEVQDARYISKNFVIDKFGEKICDVSTLSKLENNRICCLDDIYFSLIDNLNMKLSITDEVNQLLQTLNKNILENAERNYSKNITHLIDEASNLVGTQKNSILYKECFEIYEMIYMYYQGVRFNKEHIDKYLELYELVDDNLKPVFISIAYHYYSRVNIDDTVSLNIITRSIDLSVDSIIKHYLINVYYFRTHQLLKMKQQAQCNIDYCSKNENPIYLVKSHNLLAYLYKMSNPKKALHHLKLVTEIFDHENDMKENLLITYRNMARVAFSINDYERVIKIYTEYLYKDNSFLNMFFMFLIISIKKTTKDEKEIKRILTIIKNSPFEYSRFHKALINFYYNVYFEKTFKETRKAIQVFSLHKEWFIDQEVLLSVLTEDIKDVCYKFKAYSTYNEVMKILH